MRSYFFLFVTIGTLLMMIVMQQTGAPLKTAATPYGIINLEFAGNTDKATDVINAWQKTEGPDNIQAAKLNTELDFIFLFFYSVFLHYGCRSVSRLHKGVMSSLGLMMANGAIAAGVLDILENIGMLLTLHGYLNNTVTMLTFSFSIVKWILALCALIYFLIGFALYLGRKIIKPGKLSNS
jgi:hypothetical protein